MTEKAQIVCYEWRIHLTIPWMKVISGSLLCGERDVAALYLSENGLRLSSKSTNCQLTQVDRLLLDIFASTCRLYAPYTKRIQKIQAPDLIKSGSVDKLIAARAVLLSLL